MKSNSRLAPLALFLALSANAHADVTVSDAWVRGVVTGQTATGAFMTLKSSDDAKLVSAASPAAAIVQIHKMEMHNNLMTMRPVDNLALPAGKAVELKPGGYHVMLIDLKHTLAKGEKVPISLTFQDKGGTKKTVEVSAEVRDLSAH